MNNKKCLKKLPHLYYIVIISKNYILKKKRIKKNYWPGHASLNDEVPSIGFGIEIMYDCGRTCTYYVIRAYRVIQIVCFNLFTIEIIRNREKLIKISLQLRALHQLIFFKHFKIHQKISSLYFYKKARFQDDFQKIFFKTTIQILYGIIKFTIKFRFS